MKKYHQFKCQLRFVFFFILLPLQLQSLIISRNAQFQFQYQFIFTIYNYIRTRYIHTYIYAGIFVAQFDRYPQWISHKMCHFVSNVKWRVLDFINKCLLFINRFIYLLLLLLFFNLTVICLINKLSTVNVTKISIVFFFTFSFFIVVVR